MYLALFFSFLLLGYPVEYLIE